MGHSKQFFSEKNQKNASGLPDTGRPASVWETLILVLWESLADTGRHWQCLAGLKHFSDIFSEKSGRACQAEASPQACFVCNLAELFSSIPKRRMQLS